MSVIPLNSAQQLSQIYITLISPLHTQSLLFKLEICLNYKICNCILIIIFDIIY